MDSDIKEIDGKYYLELPCLPGTTVYYVGLHFDIVDGKFVADKKVFETTFYTVDIVLHRKEFGVKYFLTYEEAEEHIG